MTALETVLKERFQLVFDDTNLLQMAFTHTSYANEHRALNISHNERLEFLGDAALQLSISKYLYDKYPHKPEGDLSKMRAMIVREESLAGFAKDCGFDRFVKLGRGEEKSGGRGRATILGDLFEAFLGALLLDKGHGAVEAFIQTVMIPKVEAGRYERVKDYKTELQELLQIDGVIAIDYLVIDESGPAHDKTFQVRVVVNGKELAEGVGRSKKLAEQEAAKSALELLR